MPAATLPEQFGRYRIVKQLGKGGMGEVYLAEDTQLVRRVALKVPHIAANAGPTVLERFYREARAAAALNHPNICPVYDVGTHDGIPFLTMAYIEGQTLAHSIKVDGSFPQAMAARIIHTLALALAEAHQHGIVHRDLKPSNVMMNQRGEPVVMDFGLARIADANVARITGSGAMIGTPAYMPPEQVNGDVRAMGPACDIYSLGVILYELLTGEVPFEGSMAAMIGQILTQPPPRPSVLRPDVAPRLEAICLKAMEKKIEARYASMGAFAGALGEYARPASPPVAKAVPVQPPRPPKKAEAIVETVSDHSAPPPAKPQRVRGTQAVPVRQTERELPVVARTGRRTASAGFAARWGIAAVVGFFGLLCVAIVVGIFLRGDGAPSKKDGFPVVVKDKAFIVPKDKDGFPVVVKDKAFTVPKDKDGSPLVVKDNDKEKAFTVPKVKEPWFIVEMGFVRVRKGTFWMGGGSGSGEKGAEPKQVTIANDFELAAYPVTQGQWEAVMGAGSNPSFFSRNGGGSKEVGGVSDADLKRFPVEQVSWNDVQDFLVKLNQREQGKGWKYRLPKEAEWEYACRGAATSKEECSFDFYFAKPTNDLASSQANFNGESPAGNGAKGKYLGRTTKVGEYAPNKLGLYDMHGNVWQWCEDLYDNTGSGRVIRGGGWYAHGLSCRAAFRSRVEPSGRDYHVGFRLARVPSGS